METIKEILPQVIRNIETKKANVSGDGAEALLKKLFSKKEQKHVRFHYLKKGILGIKVDSSAWLYQLSLQKEELLGKLGTLSTAIKDIRFRLGELK